jgi:hypothetical protein
MGYYLDMAGREKGKSEEGVNLMEVLYIHV